MKQALQYLAKCYFVLIVILDFLVTLAYYDVTTYLYFSRSTGKIDIIRGFFNCHVWSF